jgi:hypothetical protein
MQGEKVQASTSWRELPLHPPLSPMQHTFTTSDLVVTAGLHLYMLGREGMIWKYSRSGRLEWKWSSQTVCHPVAMTAGPKGGLYLYCQRGTGLQQAFLGYLTTGHKFSKVYDTPLLDPNLGNSYQGGITTDDTGNVYFTVPSTPAVPGPTIVEYSPQGNLLNDIKSLQHISPRPVLYGLVVDSQGSIYAVDWERARLLKIASDGTLDAVWGSDGTNGNQFKIPSNIALDSHNHLWISDTGNGRVKEMTSKGKVLRIWGHPLPPIPTAQQVGASPTGEPTGIAVGADGCVYEWEFRSSEIRYYCGS